MRNYENMCKKIMKHLENNFNTNAYSTFVPLKCFLKGLNEFKLNIFEIHSYIKILILKFKYKHASNKKIEVNTKTSNEITENTARVRK